MTEKTAPPGRPTEFSRDAAVERAMNLFWRDGYLGVSASDLAAAMHIQRSSFYNSFGSREAVFLEALEKYAANAPDMALDTVEPGDPVLPTIAAVFRRLCRERAADKEARGCLVCNSIGELVGVDDTLGPKLAAAIENRVRVAEHVLEQAVAQKELTLPDGANAAAHSLIAFLLGINLLSKAIHDEQTLWSTCRTYLRGVGVPDSVLDMQF